MIGTHWQIANSSLHRGAPGLDMLGFDPHWVDSLPFHFDFSERTRIDTLEAVTSELPAHIEHFERTQTTRVDEITSSLSNGTAATQGQLIAALGELRGRGDVDVFDDKGKLKSRHKKIKSSDHVQLSRQLILPQIGFSRR